MRSVRSLLRRAFGFKRSLTEAKGDVGSPGRRRPTSPPQESPFLVAPGGSVSFPQSRENNKTRDALLAITGANPYPLDMGRTLDVPELNHAANAVMTAVQERCPGLFQCVPVTAEDLATALRRPDLAGPVVDGVRAEHDRLMAGGDESSLRLFREDLSVLADASAAFSALRSAYSFSGHLVVGRDGGPASNDVDPLGPVARIENLRPFPQEGPGFDLS